MILLDQFLDEASQSILNLFTIQAQCRTCKVSIKIENGDFSQLLMHVRVFHKLMVTQNEDDFSCKNSDMGDNNFDQHSNPPSPLTSKNNLNHQNLPNYVCKTDADVKEEAGVENNVPVSIKILKPTRVKVNRKKSGNKPDWKLTNAPKWDLWKHWNKDEDGLCICKHCGQTRNSNEGNDIRKLRNHTKLMHLDELDEDHQKRIKENRHKKGQQALKLRKAPIWSHFDTSDVKSSVFNCNLCNSLVIADKEPKVKALSKHLSEYHEDQYEEYKRSKEIVCTDCGKKFGTKEGLDYHVGVTHTEIIQPAEKPYLCTYCGKGFSFKISWKNHVANHTGKFNFFCSVCQKGFVIKSALEQHFITHTGEKPFKCKVCGHAYATRHGVTRHMKSH